MQQKQYDVAVVIGRFQPLHLGHVALINAAREIAREVVVLVGSSNAHRSFRNPFSAEERSRIIENNFPENLRCFPVRDSPYNEEMWIAEVQHEVSAAIHKDANVVLVGHEKSDTGYLSLFPQWSYHNSGTYFVCDEIELDASLIRSEFFYEDLCMEYTPINTLVPKSTYDFLEQYKDTPEFQRICDERMEIKNYKRSWASAPYAPMFITTDAVVVCKGHVLMVQRDVSPGEGTWAMPGGFLEQDETIKDGIFRELMEETKIDLPPAILHNSLTNVQVFDDPKRSLRGRTVTHAGLIELKNIKEFLPKVKGSDDARKARWLTFDAIRYLSDTNMIFEDHFHIIETLLKSQSI